MNPKKEILLETLKKIKGLPIMVIGDLMLDRYIWGNVDRISPEAPVPVVHVRRTEDRLGGAGNVVSNLCNLGMKVSVCGFVGRDDEGIRIMEILKESGVDSSGVFVDSARPTTVKTRVLAQRQQIVRLDREEPPSRELPLDGKLSDDFCAFTEKHIDNNRAVIFSDYGKGVITGSLIEKFEAAKLSGKIGINKVPLVVDPHPSHYALYKSMSVAKPNRKEAEIATGIRITDRESAGRAAAALIKQWNSEMMLISLSEDGLIISRASGEPDIFLDTVAREVSDVSGAGDTVTSVFSAALAAGATPEIAGTLANVAAGVVVGEVGTVPVNIAKLIKQIENPHE